MDPPFRVFTFKMLANLIYEISKTENKENDTILKKPEFLIFNEVLKKLKLFK